MIKLAHRGGYSVQSLDGIMLPLDSNMPQYRLILRFTSILSQEPFPLPQCCRIRLLLINQMIYLSVYPSLIPEWDLASSSSPLFLLHPPAQTQIPVCPKVTIFCNYMHSIKTRKICLNKRSIHNIFQKEKLLVFLQCLLFRSQECVQLTSSDGDECII